MKFNSTKFKFIKSFNGMTPDKTSEKYDEIMKGKTQQRLETFEFEERWPVQKKLNELNGKIKELSEKIKEPEDTAAMWKEHDNKFRAQNKERKVEVAKNVIKEIQNKPSASNDHVHRSNNAPQNEHKKVKQM